MLLKSSVKDKLDLEMSSSVTQMKVLDKSGSLLNLSHRSLEVTKTMKLTSLGVAG